MLLTRCVSKENNAEKINDLIKQIDTTKIDKTPVKYSIISETKNVNGKTGFNKCNLEISLEKKISRLQIETIANKLRETRQSYDKLWIFYYLKGDLKNTWAISHFTPELKVEILGKSEESINNEDKIKVEGEIIHKWNDTRQYMGLVILHKIGNKKYLKHTYSDGSFRDKELIENCNSKLIEKQNKNNEYYIIESNGNLGMYDKEGKFSEAKLVK